MVIFLKFYSLIFFNSSLSTSSRQRLPIPRPPAFLEEAVAKLLLLKVILTYSYLTADGGSVFFFDKIFIESFSCILMLEFKSSEWTLINFDSYLDFMPLLEGGGTN